MNALVVVLEEVVAVTMMTMMVIVMMPGHHCHLTFPFFNSRSNSSHLIIALQRYFSRVKVLLLFTAISIKSLSSSNSLSMLPPKSCVNIKPFLRCVLAWWLRGYPFTKLPKQ
jgi:hypothetical protein